VWIADGLYIVDARRFGTMSMVSRFHYRSLEVYIFIMLTMAWDGIHEMVDEH
jgi:hypothetical protein